MGKRKDKNGKRGGLTCECGWPLPSLDVRPAYAQVVIFCPVCDAEYAVPALVPPRVRVPDMTTESIMARSQPKPLKRRPGYLRIVPPVPGPAAPPKARG